MTDRLDVVAAFADEESVAATELASALAHEDARAYLIDVLALRGLVTDARPQAPRLGRVPPSRADGHFVVRRGGWLAAIAALVIAGIAGGYSAGRHYGSAAQVSDGRVSAVEFAPAPAPTHVFRMENGVNWNERAGGN